jgi:hypothetical protein
MAELTAGEGRFGSADKALDKGEDGYVVSELYALPSELAGSGYLERPRDVPVGETERGQSRGGESEKGQSREGEQERGQSRGTEGKRTEVRSTFE